MPENLRMALFVALSLALGSVAVIGLWRLLLFSLVNLFAWLTMKPGVRYKGRRWQIVRRYVLDRDHERCKRCGTDWGLHVHHKKPVRSGGSHQTTNLETVCTACHTRIHPHMQRTFRS